MIRNDCYQQCAAGVFGFEAIASRKSSSLQTKLNSLDEVIVEQEGKRVQDFKVGIALIENGVKFRGFPHN